MYLMDEYQCFSHSRRDPADLIRFLTFLILLEFPIAKLLDNFFGLLLFNIAVSDVVGVVLVGVSLCFVPTLWSFISLFVECIFTGLIVEFNLNSVKLLSCKWFCVSFCFTMLSVCCWSSLTFPPFACCCDESLLLFLLPTKSLLPHELISGSEIINSKIKVNFKWLFSIFYRSSVSRLSVDFFLMVLLWNC